MKQNFGFSSFPTLSQQPNRVMQLQNHASLWYRTYSEDFLVIDVGFNEASLKYVRFRMFRRRSVFYTVNEHGNSGRYDEEDDEDEDEPAIR